MDRAYIISVFTYCSFVKFNALNFVISLSDWTLNGKYFGMRKSPVRPKDPPNISPPPNTSPAKMLTNLYKPRAYNRDFTVFLKASSHF